MNKEQEAAGQTEETAESQVAADSQETVEKAEETAEAQQASEGQEAEKDSGKQFVDLDSLPPAAKRRFDRIYGHMKENERIIGEHAKVNRALLDRIKKLEAGDAQDRMADLKSQRRQAMEEADYARVDSLDDLIYEERRAAESRGVQDEIEIPEARPSEEPIPPEHMDKLSAWAGERNQSGQLLRPWASPGHPQHRKALSAIQSAVLNDDLYDVETGEGFEQVLKHVDHKMKKGSRKSASFSAVLSGSGDTAPSDGPKTPQLTLEQQRVADGLGMTAKEYAAAVKQYGVK